MKADFEERIRALEAELERKEREDNEGKKNRLLEDINDALKLIKN